MRVFKFGGASVRDVEGVRNLERVIREYSSEDLVIVVSAMGKTTNALESVLAKWSKSEDWGEELHGLMDDHKRILNSVAPTDDGVALHEEFNELMDYLNTNDPSDVDRDYDQIVSYGELWSTCIVSAFLSEVGIDNEWLDARLVVRTDSTYRTARVDWEVSQHMYDQFVDFKRTKRYVTQGFIGSDQSGCTTTLGREGSDFSAAIFAYLGDGASVTIWKDVLGMYNADPRKFEDTVLLERISYREAIELSYFGASVIHPRTVKPLQNKEIPLHVRSFVDLHHPGSLIGASTSNDTVVPSFIQSSDRTLVSITPRDFSFIVEEHMSEIFGIFADIRMKIDLMQNSALALSVVIKEDGKLKELVEVLEANYEVRYNTGVELLTIRHYTDEVLHKLLAGRTVLVEQRSRSTARFVLR